MARQGTREAVKPSCNATPPRVVALLDHDSMSETVMRAAAAVARRVQGDLLGLFLEDIELLHLAGMPFARELCLSSAAVRELDVRRMERSLRVAASPARHRFEAVAGGAPGRTFRVTRGDLLETLLETAADADVVLSSAPARGCRHRKDRPVIVLSFKLQPQAVLEALAHVVPAQQFIVDAILPVQVGGEVPARRGGVRVFRAGCLDDARDVLRGLMRERTPYSGARHPA